VAWAFQGLGTVIISLHDTDIDTYHGVASSSLACRGPWPHSPARFE
jgi:hypothetical protein